MPRRNLNIVGPQVRRLRSERGLSQPALAAECQRHGWDIDRDTVAKIEGQRRWLPDFELYLLARIFEVPLDTLLPDSKPVREAIRLYLAGPRTREQGD